MLTHCRFGNCVPYDTRAYAGIPCDFLYGQGETFVYIPFTRGEIGGNFDEYIKFFKDTKIVLELIPDECVMAARSSMCQYYLPPCGNTTVFESPESVCEDVCEYLITLCPELYVLLEEHFNERPELLPYGVDLINCSNTGQYLQPLNYCCSDLSINIRKCHWIVCEQIIVLLSSSIACTKVNDSGELVSIPSCLSTSVAVPQPSTEPRSKENGVSVGGIVGISCAIIIIVVGISIGVIFVALLLLRKRKNQKEMQKIKDFTLLQRYMHALGGCVIFYHSDTHNNADPKALMLHAIKVSVLFLVTKKPNVYVVTENEQHLAPPHPGSPVRIARVPSTYIRQMSDVDLLIPGRGLDLLDTIGQGTGNAWQQGHVLVIEALLSCSTIKIRESVLCLCR